MAPITVDQLPGVNCGLCGFRTCQELAQELETSPALIKRCIPYSDDTVNLKPVKAELAPPAYSDYPAMDGRIAPGVTSEAEWQDSLGRQFDFYLEHFPEDPGPREIILPHNPLLTREMEIRVGDILIGRPLGMSCGCPITHCGIAMNVDMRTCVIVWCVTGPLQPRQQGFKDLGYYVAEGYEGLVHQSRRELQIGVRYFFQPRRCMLQWRHSGLVNYLNRTSQGSQVRLEGLWIG